MWQNREVGTWRITKWQLKLFVINCGLDYQSNSNLMVTTKYRRANNAAAHNYLHISVLMLQNFRTQFTPKLFFRLVKSSIMVPS